MHNEAQTTGYCGKMLSVTAEEGGVAPGSRRCVLLAGVRKAGAHTISRILVHLGVDNAEQTGEFAEHINALNQDILASAGFEECSIEPLHAGWYSSLRHAEFFNRAVDLIRSTFSSTALFVLNDEAIGRLVPFWCKVLKACEVEPIVLDFYDAPENYAREMSRVFALGGEAARTIWLARAIESEQASRGFVRAQLTQEVLLTDWEAALSRTSEVLGIAWPAWSAKVRKAIVSELLQGGDDGLEPVPTKVPQADYLGQWAQAAQNVLWRWAREGEDDRGRAQMDELRRLVEEAREFIGLAFADMAQMGRELRIHKQAEKDLIARLAELQRKSDATQASAQSQAEEVAALRATLAECEAERDRLATLPQADAAELAKVEAKWAQAFRSSRETAEILTEQNALFQDAIDRLTAEVAECEKRLASAKSEVKQLKLVEISQKAELASVRSKLSELRETHTKLQKSLDESKKQVSKLRSEAASREASIETLQNALLARSAATHRSSARSAKWGAGSLSPMALLLLARPKTRKKVLRHRQMRQLVSESGLFDTGFYASRYPDVVEAGEDLLDHFITSGGAEGRHPSLCFNSRWYLNEYPDVRGAGLNPLVHYLEHGRDEGRRRRSLVDSATASAAIAEASAAPNAKSRPATAKPIDPKLQAIAETSELERTWRPRIGSWTKMLSADSGRSAEFVPMEALSQQSDARLISVGTMIVGSHAEETPQEAFDRIILFSALHQDGAPEVKLAGELADRGAPHVLLVGTGCGLGLLTDAWWNSESDLTIRFSDGFAGVVRALQGDGEGQLRCVAEASLDGSEVDLVEVRIFDPLAPLLFVLARHDGVLVNSAVLPFPSLVRGGLHYGELAALESTPGSMATLADYSQMLALEWLGWADGPDRFAIGRVEIDMRAATGTEPVFRPAMLSSIVRRFGLVVKARAGSYAPEREQLVSLIDLTGAARQIAARDTAGGSLIIPCDSVPSIYALVARRLPHDKSLVRFAVVDAATVKPLADVSLPFNADLAGSQHAEMPAHAPYVVSPDAQHVTGACGPVFPLAVRHHSTLAWEADSLMPVSPDQAMPLASDLVSEKAVTVVIDAAAEHADLANCLAALENQIGIGQIDVILCGWPEGTALPACELPVRSHEGTGLTLAGRLNAAAEMSAATFIMFLRPSVLLSDPRTIKVLSCLASRPGTASVACALVTELPDDGHTSVHSAGYFPTRVSLHSEPVFDFDQVDVARAMPAATFPVVANLTRCVIYDAAIFRTLGGFDARRFPMAMHDLDLGFRALAAGHQNLCTTLVRAAADDAALTADFPDPLAHSSVRPADWQSLLDRVTVVRELRR